MWRENEGEQQAPAPAAAVTAVTAASTEPKIRRFCRPPERASEAALPEPEPSAVTLKLRQLKADGYLDSSDVSYTQS